MFEFLINKLKAHPRKIVFTEGSDPRILEASARLLSGTFLTPVLVGNEAEIQAALPLPVKARIVQREGYKTLVYDLQRPDGSENAL